MTVYCGVDFHARQQTVAYCDTADGAPQLVELEQQAAGEVAAKAARACRVTC
jgi:hypothetical protein